MHCYMYSKRALHCLSIYLYINCIYEWTYGWENESAVSIYTTTTTTLVSVCFNPIFAPRTEYTPASLALQLTFAAICFCLPSLVWRRLGRGGRGGSLPKREGELQEAKVEAGWWVEEVSRWLSCMMYYFMPLWALNEIFTWQIHLVASCNWLCVFFWCHHSLRQSAFFRYWTWSPFNAET